MSPWQVDLISSFQISASQIYPPGRFESSGHVQTIHRDEYRVLLKLIKERRERLGMTQAECFQALGRAQSFISDIERGVRLLDVVLLRDLCSVLKTDLPSFVKAFERASPEPIGHQPDFAGETCRISGGDDLAHLSHHVSNRPAADVSVAQPEF